MLHHPIIIASYPRSGSTWLRFVLCNLFHNDQEHDYNSVNQHIPPIDHDPGLLAGIDHPHFYKTHSYQYSTNILFLHRHVGDVLESEWWYKRKMWDEKRPLDQYLHDVDYGEEWRSYANFYYPALLNVRYGDLGDPDTYRRFATFSTTAILEAIRKSTFDKMQAAEEGGFGIYPSGDLKIKFCREGKSGQWKRWPAPWQQTLLEKNQIQLKKLGYAELP
jgi:estrone sulfotransferase